MKHTEHYQLNQWESTDKVQRVDFNADNAKIDAALQSLTQVIGNKADAARLEALAGQIEALPKLFSGTYVGTGTVGKDGQNRLDFPRKPLLLFVGGTWRFWVIYGMAETASTAPNSNDRSFVVTWEGNSVSWYNDDDQRPEAQLNRAGETYRYVAFLAEE